MLASGAATLPEGQQWSYEVKWDGYRALAVKDGARVTLLSRNLKDASAGLDVARVVAQSATTPRSSTVRSSRSSSNDRPPSDFGTTPCIRSVLHIEHITSAGRHILNSAARGDDRASPGDKGRHGNPDEVLQRSLVHSPRIETTEPERASNHKWSMSRLQT